MMTQENIGKYIMEKRKEKNMTQEQFAEKIGVSNRSISRWENGKTMPDFSLFPKICETLEVSVSELLEGKGIQKEHVHLIIELMKYEEHKKQKIINKNMVGVIVCFSLIWLHNQFYVFNFIYRVDILLALLLFTGIVCIGAIFYFNNQEQKYTENEIKVFLGINQGEGMKTSGEMLQYAKRNQKVELKQYEKGFQAIEEKLLPEEVVVFTMIADTLVVNESWRDCWKPWHVSLAISTKRILLSGESIRGRFMTSYDVESFVLEDVVSVETVHGKIVIKLKNQVLTIEGKELEIVVEELISILK